MKTILIILMISYHSASSVVAEFDSREACLSAQREFEASLPGHFKGWVDMSICVPKGTPND